VTQYVALLRGIAPMNPAMSNANLRAVCEDLGLEKVATVISSGNVVFETDLADRAGLEGKLEAAWPEKLGFESTTILRTRAELERLVDLAPFGELDHGPTSYLLVTFSKHRLEVDFEVPFQPADYDWSIVAATRGEIFTVSDTTRAEGLGAMAWVEDRFGKQVSSRTWLTVARILKKMGAG
jgi:uncharacterized protein (DUF1697 family)